MQSALLKNETKKILKKGASHLKISWHSKREKKKIEKEKEKREMKKSETATINIFFLYILLEKKFGKA